MAWLVDFTMDQCRLIYNRNRSVGEATCKASLKRTINVANMIQEFSFTIMSNENICRWVQQFLRAVCNSENLKFSFSVLTTCARGYTIIA